MAVSRKEKRPFSISYWTPIKIFKKDFNCLKGMEFITTLIGVSIDKKFIPSVANVIGTDLTNYKVIRKFDFAVSLMQVSRDEKIPVA